MNIWRLVSDREPMKGTANRHANRHTFWAEEIAPSQQLLVPTVLLITLQACWAR